MNNNNEIKEKVKFLINKYKIELLFYEKFLKKLHEEIKIIKENDFVKTIKLLKEKNEIIKNINLIEQEIAPFKKEYLENKTKTEFKSKELERLLTKIAFLIDELIRIQNKNKEVLEKKLETTRKTLINLKNRTEVIKKYKEYGYTDYFVERIE